MSAGDAAGMQLCAPGVLARSGCRQLPGVQHRGLTERRLSGTGAGPRGGCLGPGLNPEEAVWDRGWTKRRLSGIGLDQEETVWDRDWTEGRLSGTGAGP